MPTCMASATVMGSSQTSYPSTSPSSSSDARLMPGRMDPAAGGVEMRTRARGVHGAVAAAASGVVPAAAAREGEGEGYVEDTMKMLQPLPSSR